MTSSSFYYSRYFPASTYGPGLHNLEIHAEKSSSAHAWNPAHAALHLQLLYSQSCTEDTDCQTYLSTGGNVHNLGKGILLPCFVRAIEAQCKDSLVWIATTDEVGDVDVTVITSQDEDQKMDSRAKEKALALQFSWALKWGFVKCKRWKISGEYDCLLDELD